MDYVTRELLLGSLPEALNEGLLHKYSIGTVINCCNQESPCALYKKLGIEWRWEPFDDESVFRGVVGEKILNAFEFVRQGIAAGKNVLVHCRVGVSRSPAFVAAYLYWSGTVPDFEKALQRVCYAHRVALPHYNTLSSFRTLLGLPADDDYKDFWEKEAVARGYRPAP